MSRPFERVARVAQSVTLAAMLGVAATGSGLLVFYRPAGDSVTTMLRIAHLLSIAVTAQGIVVVGVVGLVASKRHGETARRILGLAVSLVAFVFSIFTGVLLGWDQLALATVAVGNEIRGYGWIIGTDVEFALVDDANVGVDTIQRLLTVHLGAAVVLLLAGLMIPRLLSRHADSQAEQ